VHSRRDARLIRHAFVTAGLAPPRDLEERLLERHRRLDSHSEEHVAAMHFMRGPEEEDAALALARALGFARERALRAVTALADAREVPPDGERQAAVRALADVAHLVRDSFSRGHATRAPGPGGPRVVAMRAWESDKKPQRGFGLVHVVAHDLRFERPFERWAPEVLASDAAVREVTQLIARCAALGKEGERGFEVDWEAFVARWFVPPGRSPPDNA
jgi:hypothetical protein